MTNPTYQTPQGAETSPQNIASYSYTNKEDIKVLQIPPPPPIRLHFYRFSISDHSDFPICPKKKLYGEIFGSRKKRETQCENPTYIYSNNYSSNSIVVPGSLTLMGSYDFSHI